MRRVYIRCYERNSPCSSSALHRTVPKCSRVTVISNHKLHFSVATKALYKSYFFFKDKIHIFTNSSHMYTHRKWPRELCGPSVVWHCWRINVCASLNVKKPFWDFWPDRFQLSKSPFIKSDELRLQNSKHSKYEWRLKWHFICMKRN